jgi:hypothetical protein
MIKIDFGYLPLILFVIFLGLKITGVINWDSIWVFSPIWIPIILIFMLIIAIYILKSIIEQ